MIKRKTMLLSVQNTYNSHHTVLTKRSQTNNMGTQLWFYVNIDKRQRAAEYYRFWMGSGPSWLTWKCDPWRLRRTTSTMLLRCGGTAEPIWKYLYCKQTEQNIKLWHVWQMYVREEHSEHGRRVPCFYAAPSAIPADGKSEVF